MAGLLVVAALSSIAYADSSYFIYPPASGPAYSFAGNLQFAIGSVAQLQWYSDIPTYDINLWHQPAPSGNSSFAGTILSVSGNGLGTTTYNWTVNIFSTSLADSPVYYISADYPALTRVWSSHYFNVAAAPARPSSSTVTTSSISTTTSSTQTTTSQTATTAASTQAEGASQTAASTSTTTASNAANMTATTVGLGVGLGIGIPLILIAAGFLALRWHRDRRAAMAASSPMAQGSELGSNAAWSAGSEQQIYEADPKYVPVNVVHEAPNTFGPYEAGEGKPR